MKSNLIEVDLQSETHKVKFNSPIDSVKIDGQKLNDIHDLAVKVDKSSLYIATLTKRITSLAYVATFLVIMAVVLISTIGGWLFSNKDRINESLNSSKTEMLKLQNTNGTMNQKLRSLQNTNGVMAQKLRSLGWHWRDRQWNQIEK